MSAPIIWIDFNNIHVNIWETSVSLEETLNARDKTQLTYLLLINLVYIQKKIFHTKNMQLLQIKCTSQYTFIIKWLFSILKHTSSNKTVKCKWLRWYITRIIFHLVLIYSHPRAIYFLWDCNTISFSFFLEMQWIIGMKGSKVRQQ